MYGIDFGTTYTVVSYRDNEEIKYLNFDGSFLLKSSINNYDSLKSFILLESKNNNFDKNLINSLRCFFKKVYLEIESQLSDFQEYKNCVITVPVRFNDIAKNIIKEIAVLENFHVIKLLSEPIAACIGTLNNSFKNGYYIVYDLGGGTFDASLIKFQDDIYHTIKVDGIEDFGGEDITKYISKKQKISFSEAEVLKKNNLLDLDNLLKMTYDIIFNLASNYEINALILNGGSCYLQNIESFFAKKFKIIKGENLQLMVSKGACIYANDFVEKKRFLIDVTPMNLGIEVLGDEMNIMIPANSPLPFIKTEQFLPVNNKVAINIYQGPSNLITDATKLYSFVLESKDMFSMTFILDYDGILTIKFLDNVISLKNIYIK